MKLTTTLAFVLFTLIGLQAQTGKLYFSDSQQNQINSVGTDGTNLTVAVKGDLPTDISYSPSVNLVFWADKKKGNIQSIFPNGSNPLVVVPNLSDPGGVAIDQANSKLYIMETGKNRIIRTELDGSSLTPLVTGIDRGGDIILDVPNDLMYWAQEFPGKIWRSRLNGMNKTELVSTDNFPDDLRLEPAAGFIYWRTNSGIFRADLSGQNKSTVVNAGTTAFDLKNNQIYFLQWGNDGLYRADANGLGSTKIGSNVFYNGYAIEVNPSDSMVYYLSGEYGQFLRKAKWDGTQPKTLKEREVYRPGQINYNPTTETFLWVNMHSSFQDDTSSSIQVWNKLLGDKPLTFLKEAPNNKRYLSTTVDWSAGEVFWAESTNTTSINRIKLSGAGAANLVNSGLQFPLYQKFNSQNGRLYWTDFGEDKFMSILPNGTDIQTVASGLDGAGGFDFDTINQKIYLASGGSSRDIKRMNYDGTQIETLVSGLFFPKSVAVNPLLDEIYWIDGSKLSKSKKDGTQVTNVIAPVSFTSYEDVIFVATPNSSVQQTSPIDAEFYYADYQVNIRFNQPQNAEISIFSVLGQKVNTEFLTNQTAYQFEASGLASGIYYMYVRNAKGQTGVFGFAVHR